MCDCRAGNPANTLHCSPGPANLQSHQTAALGVLCADRAGASYLQPGPTHHSIDRRAGVVPASDRGSQPELLQPAATNHALGKLSLRRLSPARPELQHSPSQPVQPEQLHQPRPLPLPGGDSGAAGLCAAGAVWRRCGQDKLRGAAAASLTGTTPCQSAECGTVAHSCHLTQ